MDENRFNLAPGRFLVARPLLGDPNFDRSVVLISDYNKEGAMGFVLNQTLEIKLDHITVDFPSFEVPVYLGGPVQQDSLFFLHRKQSLIPGSQSIGAGIYWGGDINAIKELISANLIAPHEIRFYLGYSGWGAGQLDFEMEQESWWSVPGDAQSVFEQSAEELWPSLLRQQGQEHWLWQNTPPDPNLN